MLRFFFGRVYDVGNLGPAIFFYSEWYGSSCTFQLSFFNINKCNFKISGVTISLILEMSRVRIYVMQSLNDGYLTERRNGWYLMDKS
jgi:hypothetical protein